ncbi:MAG: FIST signal transduction protein [Candidatus Nanohaloarchaea archaeon]
MTSEQTSSLNVASAQSVEKDPYDAGKEIAEKIDQETGNPGLAFVFSSEKLADEELLKGIKEVLGDTTVIGTSTGGELTDQGISTGTAVMMAIEADDLEVGVGIGENISDDNRKAGMTAAGKALDDLGEHNYVIRSLQREGIEWRNETPVNFNVFSTTLTGNGSEVMRGVQEVLGPGAHVTGGLAGDDWQLNETYVYHNETVYNDALVVAAVKTRHNFTHGVKHGLERSDERYQVTSSDANIVHELGGEPAADVYEDLYGAKGRTPNFIMTKPLGIEAGEEEVRLRDPLDIQDDGSIVYAAEVKEGSVVYIMESPSEKMIEAAKEAAKEAVEKAGNPDKDRIKGVVMHDCVCRWNCFNDEETRNKEVEAVREVVGEDTPVIGWYTYGEIALPRALAGVHNQTLVLEVFVEEEN